MLTLDLAVGGMCAATALTLSIQCVCQAKALDKAAIWTTVYAILAQARLPMTDEERTYAASAVYEAVRDRKGRVMVPVEDETVCLKIEWLDAEG